MEDHGNAVLVVGNPEPKGPVRFDAERSAAGGRIIDTRAYVSTLSFGFNNRPLRVEDRFDNPLGFVVTRYRRDAEGATQ